MKLEFLVRGRPVPQGSMRAISVPNLRYSVLVSDNPDLKSWRKKVRKAAEAAMREAGMEMLAKDIPVKLQLQSCFVRPKSVTREHMTVKPDASKLLRAVEDSLNKVVWADDSQIVRATTAKSYGDFERVEIRVEAVFGSQLLIKDYIKELEEEIIRL